jgi:hypothetical protein
MDPIDSERLDLPSASDAYARRRCLGRTQLIRHLKETGKLEKKTLEEGRSADGRYATFGLNVHAAWAGQQVMLEAFEAETLEKLKRLENLLVSDWASGREIRLFAREERLWLHHGLEPLHSGRYDVAYVTRDTSAMLIIEGKTLFHPVAPADTNDQLRELVALAHYNYPGVLTLSVAILQPHVERPLSIATYDSLEAELALRLLRWHLADIAQPDLPRIYGPWCRFCPALEFCPEARASIEPILASEFDSDLQGRLALPIGTDGAAFLRRVLAARALCESLQAAYKAFLSENPDALPGFSLKPGKSKRGITDVGAAYDALAGTVSLEDFLECASVSVTRLQDALGKATGLKGKSLRDTFNARLGDVLEFKTDAPSLEDTE